MERPMIDHQSRRYKRGASHYWAETCAGIACHWCGMRAHWSGAKEPCAFPAGAKKGRAPKRMPDPSVDLVSVVEMERVVRR